jgi:RimJ/RimL family protein N-acetyltransferase
VTDLVIPTLETERLRLRPLRPGDADDFIALHADPEVMHHLGGPWSPDRGWRTLAFCIGYWQLRRPGYWAVEHRETGSFLGLAGFYEQEGGLGCELTGRLVRGAWGQGYAIEAGRALLHHGFTVWNLKDLVSLTHPDNHASIRAVQGLGGTLQGSVEHKGRELLRFLYARPAERAA